MRKIVLFALCGILVGGVSDIVGQDPMHTSVVRKGDRVWFLTANSKKDTLVKTKGRGQYDYRTIESGSAEVLVLALTSDEMLSSEELLAMYHSPSQTLPEKKFTKRERVIEKATWQSGFLFDKVLVSYTTPIIFRGNMTIYARPASEEVQRINHFMMLCVLFLVFICGCLFIRLKPRSYNQDNEIWIGTFLFWVLSFVVAYFVLDSPVWFFLLAGLGLRAVVWLFGERYPLFLLLVEAITVSAFVAWFVVIPACLYAVLVAIAIGYFGRKRLAEERDIVVGVWQRIFKKENPA